MTLCKVYSTNQFMRQYYVPLSYWGKRKKLHSASFCRAAEPFLLCHLRTPRRDQNASVTIKHVYTKQQRVNAQCNAPSIAHASAFKRPVTTPLSRVYTPFDKNTSVKERHRALKPKAEFGKERVQRA